MTAALTIGAGLVVFPTLGQSLLPSFKENDLITYWATKPGTSLPETMRIAASPAAATTRRPSRQWSTARRTPGRRSSGTRSTASTSTSSGSPRPGRRLRPGRRRAQRSDRQLSRPVPHRADVSQGAGQGGPERVERGDRRARLRSGRQRPPKKAEEIAARMGEVDGIIDERVEQIEQIPQIEVEVDVARRAATGSRPGTSAASLPRCSRARRSATSSTAARRTTCTCGASPPPATA